MVRDIERDRDQYSFLISAIEAFLKQGREAHTTGFRRHPGTWRWAITQERGRDNLRRNLRWGLNL